MTLTHPGDTILKASPPGVADGWASEGTSRVPLLNPFPVPRIPSDSFGDISRKSCQLSSKSRQKSCARQRLLSDSDSVIDALNWCAASRGPPGPRAFCCEPLSPCQAGLHAQVIHAVLERREGHAIPSQRSAFMELTRGRAIYSDEPGNINIAAFSTIDKVSLPDSVEGAPLLDDVVAPCATHYLENPELMLRPEAEIRACDPPPQAHWDPGLQRSQKKLLGFYKHLLDIGLITLALGGTAVEQLGIFFVIKSGKDTIRLIIDARRVNRIFAAPPGISLASSESLARIEVELPEGVDLTSPDSEALLRELKASLGVTDIRDCFHRYRIGRNLSKFFGVGSVAAHELGLTGTTVDDKVLGRDDRVDLLWS